MSTIAIVTHIYYENSYDNLRDYFLLFKNKKGIYFFNVSENSRNSILKIKTDFPNSYIIQTSNVGKDIGGKLALIDLCIKLKVNPDYYIFLHDKQSPHSALGEIWRDKLYRILEKENIAILQDIFDKNKNVGILAAKEFIMNEYDSNTNSFNSTNNLILKKMLSYYFPNLQMFDFVGGTMFWARANIINSFFTKHNPLTIRSTLEHGNVFDNNSGTHTHSWERMLSWLALAQGYTIKGI